VETLGRNSRLRKRGRASAGGYALLGVNLSSWIRPLSKRTFEIAVLHNSLNISILCWSARLAMQMKDEASSSKLAI